jgi:prepilin-type N-terminal cleavage/methylation domain-containing protein
MSQRPASDVNGATRRDEGFTLPELLISILISGILIVSISMAFTTVLRTQSQATDRLAESKDITFVQTWLPVDLSSALETFTTPSDSQLLAELAAVQPNPMTIYALQPGGAGLPGTNVLTLVRPDLDVRPTTYYLVSYRYHQVGGQWQISRFEIRNAPDGSESIKTVGVAHEVPAPPATWDPSQSPTFAMQVTARNQVILRPIGENVTISFKSQNSFISGGAGLSAENFLPSTGVGTLKPPTAPPSRCGGRMALVIDTSGSMGPHSTAAKSAAKGFIDGFTGTPYSITLNGFSTSAYGMIGTNGSQENRAPYVSLLNPGPAVQGLKNRIDGIVWDGWTNWEDGFRVPISANNGTRAGVPYGVDQPDLLVFITDGDPNRIRSNTGAPQSANSAVSTTAAVGLADAARRSGTETIGVMAGTAGNNSASINRLHDVAGGVGSRVLWNGRVNPDGSVELGNAKDANVFRGSFAELGGVLKSIMIAECGGTLTVQKRVETSPGVLETPPTGEFTFLADGLERTLDRDVTSSVTFDYSFPPGVGTKPIELLETTPGYRFLRAECTAGGEPVTGITPAPDNTPGVVVPVSVDRAVSCLMISEPS